MPIMNTRKIAAVLASGALLGGAGFGVAEAAKTNNGSKSSQSARPGGKRGGPIPSAALAKIATALGVSTADLRTAMQANKPAQPASGDQGRGGPCDIAADLATALGVEESAVQEILDANRPARPATRPAPGTAPPKPDHTKLIAALATGLSIEQDKVQAAFDKLDADREAEHESRHTAMYAALAKALDKTVAEVQAAFEANRPAKPTS